MTRPMRISLILLLTLFGFQLFAQKSLILTNGESIEFQKIKSFPDFFELKINGEKDRIEIQHDEVVGYSDRRTGITYFKVPNTNLDVNLFREEGPYEFLERVVEGKINVYKKIVTTTTYSPNGPMVSSTSYLFLQKGLWFEKVFNSGMKLSKSDYLRKIGEMIKDDPETLNKFNSKFKLKYDNLISLISFYNNHQ